MLEFVPTFIFYGTVGIYKTLAMTYIDGMCFREFEKMNVREKRACLDCVQKLHSFKIVHGDLEPWNFIITYNASKIKDAIFVFAYFYWFFYWFPPFFLTLDPKAYLIDFGKSALNCSKAEVKSEQEYLRLRLGI